MAAVHMLALGPFAFGVDTAGYHQLQRTMQFKHPSLSRVGLRDSDQAIGPGEEQITITGVVAPAVTGTLASITRLQQMGQGGAAYVLVDGAGYVYGTYHIDSLQETHTAHLEDGTPRKVEFSLSLTRDDAMPADEPASSSTKAAA